jgi:hypothetical protein
MKITAEFDDKSIQEIYYDGIIEYKRKIIGNEELLELVDKVNFVFASKEKAP